MSNIHRSRTAPAGGRRNVNAKNSTMLESGGASPPPSPMTAANKRKSTSSCEKNRSGDSKHSSALESNSCDLYPQLLRNATNSDLYPQLLKNATNSSSPPNYNSPSNLFSEPRSE